MSEAERLALLAGSGVDPTAYEAGEFEGAVAALIADGQYFVAHDLARTGLERFADDPALRRLAAEAALRAGALGEAKRLAAPLEGALVRRNPKVRAAYDRMAEVLRTVESPGKPPGEPADAGLDAVAGLAGALAELGRAQAGATEGETFLLLGRLHLALWRRDGGDEELAAAADVLADGVRLTGRGDLAAEAAVAAYLAGDTARAGELAAQAVADPDLPDAARLEALLIAGEAGRAETALAAEPPERGAAAALRTRLDQLAAAGLAAPTALLAAVRPPVIALFTGHMIDAPDRASPRFPAHLEAEAKAAIAAELAAIDCRVGYSAAASGGDILFLEALAERGAEVNIVLPFAKPDFIAASVAAAGERWVARFENLLKIAHTVSYATTEKHLGDDVLFRYGAQVMEGMAELRAELLGAEPYLVALWDGTPTRIVGGTADMAALWAPTGRLRLVNLTALRAPGGDAPDDEALIRRLMEAPPPSEDATHTGRRRIQAMLFADVVGFSKIDEEHVPDFVRFLTHVSEAMRDAPDPVFLNTWGDAIFAVCDKAEAMARYALALQAAIGEARAKLTGPAAGLDLRIALHAGPAYRETDPLTGRPNFYGGHVNRAARIEPVTVPGQVYCSEQFTALLAAEAVQQGETAGGPDRPWRVEYVGDMALAKKFGKQKVYSLRGA